MASDYSVAQADATRLDDVGPLVQAMVEVNTGAVRLYERNWLRPYYRELPGRL